MSTQSSVGSAINSPPAWFWVVSVLGVLYFLMDTSAFFMRVMMTDEALAAMPEARRQLSEGFPLWVKIVFAFEVFGGLFGCVGLLLRKKWSLPLFYLSILGVLSQTSYLYFLSDAISVMGTMAVVMPLVAILIGIGMILLAKASLSKGWLV